MREISVKSKGKKIKVNSIDVQEILLLTSDFDSISDISDMITQQGVFVYDCMLDKEYVDLDSLTEAVNEYIDDYRDISFEDISRYIKGLADEIAIDIEEEYNIENVSCSFNIYSLEIMNKEFKLVLVVSFDKEVTNNIDNISEIIAKRQFLGKSKFYS